MISIPPIDWALFKTWLDAQYSHSHAGTVYNFATQYYEAAFDASKAAQLKTMTTDKRRYVMNSLSAISKFTGNYNVWQDVRKQAGLKWQSTDKMRIVRALLSQESNGAIDWLKAALPKLPVIYRVPLVFTALSGMRAGEACQSCGLISTLNQQGKLDEYYDRELCMLQHFKFPKMFLRNTKNAYISFISHRLIEVASRSVPTTTNAIQMALKRNLCLPVQTKQLRKCFGTMLRKNLEREMIDLVQGRVDGSVFVAHYYRPLITEIRDKVLSATKNLEDELLSFM